MLKGNGSKNSSNSDRHNDFEFEALLDLRVLKIAPFVFDSNRLHVASTDPVHLGDYKSGDLDNAVLDRQNVFGDEE